MRNTDSFRSVRGVIGWVPCLCALFACGAPGGGAGDGGRLFEDAEISRDDAGTACTPPSAWMPSSIVLVPGQVLVLDAGVRVDAAMVMVRFDDGAPLPIAAPDSRSISVLTPELSPGEHTLSVVACGVPWSATAIIEAAPEIVSPEAVFADVESALSARLDALAASPEVGAAGVADLVALLEQASTELAALPETERRALAATLLANRALFDRQVPMCSESACDERLRCLSPRIVVFVVQLLALGGLAATIPPPANLIALIGIGVVLGEFASDNSDAVFDECLQPLLDSLGFGTRLVGAGGGATPLGPRRTDLGLVGAGRALDIVVSAEYAPLEATDGVGNADVADMKVGVARILEIWSALESTLRTLGRSLGFPLPVPGTETSFDAVLALVSVEIETPPPGLTLEAVALDGSLSLTFDYAGAEPVEATVAFHYANPGIRTFTQRVAVTVMQEECGGHSQRCCGDGTCSAPLRCGPDGYCRGGRDGEPCTTGADCDNHRCGPAGACDSSGICTEDAHCWTDPPPDTGDIAERCGPGGLCVEVTCASDADCAPGHCVLRVNAGWSRWLCEPIVEGSPCASETDCLPEQLCDPDGRCRARGLVCTTLADCLGGTGTGWATCLNGYCAGAVGTCTGCSADSACHPDLGFCAPLCSSGCVGSVCGLGGVCGGYLGTRCALDSQCTSSLCVDGVCQPTTYGVCHGDDDCAPDMRCNPSEHCQAGVAGEPCDFDDDCDGSLRLFSGGGGSCGLEANGCGPTGVCQYGAPGDPCVSDVDCASDWDVAGDCTATRALACVRGQCVLGHEREPCELDSQCFQTHCGPLAVCQSGDEGDPCWDHADCNDLCGPDGVCRRGTPGTPCTSDDQCESPYLCGAGHCQRGSEGDPCTGEWDCNDVHDCWFERCTAS